MEKSKFGLTWRFTDYCYSEISHFIECSDSIPNEDGLRDRYQDFLEKFLSKEIKKATEVDHDLIGLFIGDLDNRAHIDFLEDNWLEDAHIVAGGQRFWERSQKLRAIHPTIEVS